MSSHSESKSYTLSFYNPWLPSATLDLNPASLLPVPNCPDSTSQHECTKLLDFTLTRFHPITSEHILQSPHLLIDGSVSKAISSQVGYAITEGYHDSQSYLPWEVVEAAALPAVTTSHQHNLLHSPELLLSQKVKLSTSMQALNMLIISCIHMPRSGTRGFLTAKNTPMQNGPVTQDLIEVALLPQRPAVFHCKGHQILPDRIKSWKHYLWK